jgi:hypothetical protein
VQADGALLGREAGSTGGRARSGDGAGADVEKRSVAHIPGKLAPMALTISGKVVPCAAKTRVVRFLVRIGEAATNEHPMVPALSGSAPILE